MLRRALIGAVLAMAALLLVRCATPPEPPPPPAPAPEPDWIVVAGERFPIGTRVVTWQEPGGYSAYLHGKHFDLTEPPDGKRRYSTRPGLHSDDVTLQDVQQVVHQFVVHYDVCGCARQCFKVLQDVRTLSVHFLLDLDGTIYQTLDLQEKAWHATIANDFSVGVEIAHPGAYPQPLGAAMRVWYERDEQGWRQKFPAWMTETGVRTPGYVARPDRPEIVSGFVQTRTYYQFDFTTEQYEALARLCAGLERALPRIRLEAPRGADGAVVDRVLPEAELRAFDGIVGHVHVQQNKQDPGPAFQWARVLLDARQLRQR
jgi:N-acetyl-anhydromuramyl-L-alanine amidase AmpD